MKFVKCLNCDEQVTLDYSSAERKIRNDGTELEPNLIEFYRFTCRHCGTPIVEDLPEAESLTSALTRSNP